MGGIVVEGLNKTYRGGRVHALRNFSVSIKRGEIFGVIGPNGAGKTTFMGCLLGLLRPDSGRITIDDKPVDDLSVLAMTGYVPERLAFDRWMTGRRFLAYHHALANRPSALRKAKVATLLEQVGLDQAAAKRNVKKYSRGMLQRLGLAQALIGEPKYLFLDEPTSGMDPIGVMMVRGILQELRSQGVTVVLNSHQLEQVEQLCDRVAFVSQGEVTSVESLSVGATAKRFIVVTVASGHPIDRVGEPRLKALADQAGASLMGSTGNEIRFEVDGEEGAAKLLAALVQGGLPVTQAVPAVGRLERLFVEPSRGGDS